MLPCNPWLRLKPGPIPANLLHRGIRWLLADASIERCFAITHPAKDYQLTLPRQRGTTASIAYQPPSHCILECHSHGQAAAFFSGADDRDEQSLRLYGVVGRGPDDQPSLLLRIGIYGHYYPLALHRICQGNRHCHYQEEPCPCRTISRH